MVGYYNQGVPTSVDLENNSNQKKYTVNQPSKKGLVISKPLCALMAIGAFLLALLVGLLVFFLVPRYCNGEKPPEALTQTHLQELNNGDKIVTSDKSDKNNDKAEDYVDERLPRSIEPTHYRIRIMPDMDNFTTSGSVRMTLKVLAETNEIVFHLRDISVVDHSVAVSSTKSGSSPVKISKKEYLPGDKYRIVLKRQLTKGHEYELDLDYTGVLSKHLVGFYGGRYNDHGQERVFASTQFSPTDARRAFPCYDEPSFKAKFTIAVARPEEMKTLSNMPIFNSTAFTNQNASSTNWYWDEYPETPKMSTYLVAFMVSELKQEPTSDPLMKFWAREDLISQTAYAAEIGPKILKFFEKYFDIKFPLPKIDIVAVPTFGFSGMENWGLITFRESTLLYDPNVSTNSDKRGTATVLSHELAHQWFGNLVTPKFWNDVWLKEGFSDYMGLIGVDHAEPKWKILDEFAISETLSAMDADAFESSRPISSDNVRNTHQIRALFDSISYKKGAAIVRMMNHFLGEKTFKEGLIQFLKKYQYANADRKDLFAELTQVARKNEILKPDEDVATIMDTWTGRSGYPVVTALVDYEQQKIMISQKRFYYETKDEKSSWWVPISFVSNSTESSPNFTDTSPKYWLRGDSEIIDDVNVTQDDWYLLNLNQTGYFVVNYNERNWKKLSENIMDFPPQVRAQLISDSMDLARANLINYDIPLTMIAKMAVLDDQIMFVPTNTAFIKLGFLSNILSETPAFGFFEEYHKNIFQDTYKKVILEDTVDDYITRRIRGVVLHWSCQSPESRCTHMAKTAFRDWIVRGKEVQHNLRSIVYCAAIREGGEIEWNFAFRKYMETKGPSEKATILSALGCTKLKWLLSRYMEKLLSDPSIRIQDADILFQSVASNPVGTQIAFDFLRKNWAAILEHHGDGFNIVARMVLGLGQYLNTPFQLAEFVRFRDSVRGNQSTTRAFETALENIRANVEWMEKNYNQVEQWLQNNRDLRARFREEMKMVDYLNNNRGSRRANRYSGRA